MKPWTGIALMHEAEFIAAALPLFEAGEVEVLEWSYDTIALPEHEPVWLSILLQEYAAKGRLLAHGVRYSLLNGDHSKQQEAWLKQTAAELKRYPYRHITEHFGFMSSSHFHKGAPLPVPLNKQTLAIGQDRLKRLQQVAGLPAGIENLAFSFSMEQVKEQGQFLEKLVEPVKGFIILDLHNIWCQAVNFRTDPQSLIDAYPLHLVKEIHLSGGSWSTVSSSKDPVRRDTHDEALPKEVLGLLAYALPKCPQTEAVIFERLGDSLNGEEDRLQFAEDFRTIKQAVERLCEGQPGPSELVNLQTTGREVTTSPLISTTLSLQQQQLIRLLSQNAHPGETIRALRHDSSLAAYGWNVDQWTDAMIETAIQLLKKWN